ncbi:MAG TPA: hypothetical protein VFB45_17690 [Pseudolabrys sp.]|nr:hypothetical protein [Pseudolabrys sp.]
MRTVCLLLVMMTLLAACATQPDFRAGGVGGGRYSRGTAGVGWPL